MCLAVPMRIVSIDDGVATIEVGGVTQRAGLMLVPEARVGDFVLVHAGYAITVLDAEEAAERERLFAEFRDFEMHDAQTDDGRIDDARTDDAGIDDARTDDAGIEDAGDDAGIENAGDDAGIEDDAEWPGPRPS